MECKHVAIMNHLKQSKLANLGEVSLNLIQMRENAAGKYLTINCPSPINQTIFLFISQAGRTTK